MELTWDNIENIRLSKNGNFRDIIKKRTYYLKVCEYCNHEYFGNRKDNKYCCHECSTKICSDETKKKMSEKVKQRIC